MNVASRERWNRLWANAGPPFDAPGWYDRLAALYSEPHRHYHNFRHIAECLTEFDHVRPLAADPFAVEAAIWFHDAVYDPHSHDNEERSAELAKQCNLEAGMDARIAGSVAQLVLATKSHDPWANVDALLLVDADLSILGKPRARFEEYENQIRREYVWVPNNVFAAERSRILERFLARERIFVTEPFRRYEHQARANLRYSLERLRGECAA